MSRFGGFGKRPYPPPMRDDFMFDRRHGPPDMFDRRPALPDMYDQYDRGDFYPPPPRFARFAPPPQDDDFSDLPMSPFLKRMMGGSLPERPVISSREEILMDLGQSVVSSLKGGQKLSTNPLIREKLETLIQVEKMEEEMPPRPLLAPPRGPYSRYDSFYEKEFVPPVPPRPLPPGMGFSAPPKLPLPPLHNDWYQFLRIGKDFDRNRIYASDNELTKYFQMMREKRPLILNELVQKRLKNTFSFEISQTKNPERRNWLIVQHQRVANHDKNAPKVSNTLGNSRQIGGLNSSSNTVVAKKKRRRDSEWKKQKKRIRDKRPPQDETDRRITNYLKALVFELCGDENEDHAVLVLRAIATNPNVIKCLMTESKTFLDQKFGAGSDLEVTNKKRSYLINFSRKHTEETIETLRSLMRSVKKVDDTIYEKYNAVLSGKKVDETMFANLTDYVLEPGKSEDEFIVDFKYDFVRFVFEKFCFKIVENFCVTKDRRKRINFFMNNGFLAGLIWTMAQGKARELPGAAMKYVTSMDRPCQENSLKIDNKMLAKVMAKENYAIQTNYLDFTAQRDLLPIQEKTFRKCIELFDPKASIVKYQLVDYTPYNPLPRDYKLFVLSEIMKFVYLQVMECVVKNPNLITKTYAVMEKDA